MAKTMYIKREKHLLLPFLKLDELITKASKEHPDNSKIDDLIRTWIERSREYKTGINIPVTHKEFTFLKELIEAPF